MLKALILFCLCWNVTQAAGAGLGPVKGHPSSARTGTGRPTAFIAPRYVPPSSSAFKYKSYKEWKAEQMQYWKSRGQADMVKDLGLPDFFAAYVTKQTDQAQAIKEVSGRLSPEEVAELMTIYANAVFSSNPSIEAAHRTELPGKEASRQP